MAASNAKGMDPNLKRPSDSAFKQQRLPAWQPILTAGTVLPTFFVIGIAFIPVGVVLLHVSDQVMEISKDYTDCLNEMGKPCAEVIEGPNSEPCQCNITFTLDKAFNAPVMMYYGLTNFYQNHRRYVKSRDDNQLRGQIDPINPTAPSSDCQPFAYDEDKRPILPCGAIANSLFSDELSLYRDGEEVPLLKTGIAWPSDKSIKFENPPGPLKEAFKNYAKPKNWQKNLWELDPNNTANNGLQNEDLIVWMRTAALPTFRKLYRRINHTTKNYTEGLPAGNYTLVVKYSYQVKSFEGTKKMILSTVSGLGGKNPFLGIAYIVVGAICFLLGIVFLFIHIKCGKRAHAVRSIGAMSASLAECDARGMSTHADRGPEDRGVQPSRSPARAGDAERIGGSTECDPTGTVVPGTHVESCCLSAVYMLRLATYFQLGGCPTDSTAKWSGDTGIAGVAYPQVLLIEAYSHVRNGFPPWRRCYLAPVRASRTHQGYTCEL